MNIHKKIILFLAPLFFVSFNASAEEMGSSCGDMEVWDAPMGMCMPIAMAGMPMKMAMIHGNLFAAGISGQGPRGRDAFASTNMIMADMGTSLGDSHYLNLDLMATAEKWTIPTRGYPELLQIGEKNANGAPYIDAQHPHSSPIMGLTLSDTIRFSQSSKNHLKLFIAPRGESTDGPIAFMHRITGSVNPDAPLGHHIGQDVGHITSTVVGASVKLDATRLEVSAFHGHEPEPARVDLPLGTPNSFAFRMMQEFLDQWLVMASVAHVREPEEDDASVSFVNRYSTSVYLRKEISPTWTIHNAFIYGLITNYDHATTPLSSFGEEFLVRGNSQSIWGRIEVLQRTPNELRVPIAEGNPNKGLWVTAVTLGYTHKLARFGGDENSAELGLGASGTKDFLPSAFIQAYDGNPWTGKLFVQLNGMGMWDI